MGKGIKIKSIEAGSLYDYELGNRNKFDLGSATLPQSLFTDYMMNNGMKVNEKLGTCKDFIMMKYNYGTNGLTSAKLRIKQYEDMITINWTKYYDDIEVECISKLKNEDEKEKAIAKRVKNLNRGLKDEIITYKMLMRSVGKAKDGDCVFCNEKLWTKAISWLTMNLYDKMPEGNSPIIEMSAYQVLTTAVKIGSIELSPKNILILKDMPSFTDVKAVSVKVHEVPYIIKTLDFKQIEKEANESGYTFYKTKTNRDGYTYIKTRTDKSIGDLGITIIKKNDGKLLDIEAMEPQAKNLEHSFYKKFCMKNDGYELLAKDESTVDEYGFNKEYKYKTVYKKECYVDRHDGNKVKVSNTMWDGMGILDHKYFEEAECEEFMYCRSTMSKVCWFDGEVVQYLKDYYKERYYDDDCTIEDMFGNDIKVRDIHAITTDNGIKFLKFKELVGSGTEKEIYDHWCNFMADNKNLWGIVKSAHNSKYGQLQRSSYQMNNSLPTTNVETLTKIAQCTVNYTNDLKEDNNKFLSHLEATNNSYTINDVILGLANHNYSFVTTGWYKTRKSRIISKLKRERFMQGKLMQDAANLTIAGNVIALLMYATNQEWEQDKSLNIIENGVQCYTKRFADTRELCAFRSPHNSPNNIAYLVNHHSKEMEKYFPHLGKNVIVINMLKTDIQSRLNGMDEDSDFAYVTDQFDTVNLSKLCCKEYPTIINEIPEEKSAYNKTMTDYAIMDNKIANNQSAIGESSNLSQLALSYYYNKLANTGDKDTNLEDVFITGSVIAQLAIDSAKKTFDITPTTELSRLSNLKCMKPEKRYPRFYAEIQKGKVDKNGRIKDKKEAKQIIEDSVIIDCKCPMQILADIIDEGVKDGRGKSNGKNVDIESIFIKNKNKRDIDDKQITKVENLIIDYDKAMQDLDKDNEGYKDEAESLTLEVYNKIASLTISNVNMNKLISKAMGFEVGKKTNQKYCERMLERLYAYDKEKFLRQFVQKSSSKKLLKGA